jgi:hypothetical protein
MLKQEAAFTLWCSDIARDRARAGDAERVRCATRCTDSEPLTGESRSIGSPRDFAASALPASKET